MKSISYPYPGLPRALPRRNPYPARRARRSANPWLWLIGSAGLFAIVMLPFVLLGAFLAFAALSGRVYSGVELSGQPVGGLTRAALVEKIDQEWNRQPRLVLTDGTHSWPASLADLGLRIDSQATAERAFAIGRGPRALQELLWLTRFQTVQVEPVIMFDPAAAQSGLARMAKGMDLPARDAELRLVNGQWTALPGQPGRALDVDATLRAIAVDPRAIISSGYVPLFFHPVLPQVADLTPMLQELRAALETPLRLSAYDPITDETLDWSVPKEEFASWVTIDQRNPGAPLHLDDQRLTAYLESWQANLGGERSIAPFSPPADLTALWQSGEPLSLTLRHNPTRYIVEPGDTLSRIAFKVGMPYWKIEQANPGIDPDRLQGGQVLQIPSKNDLLPLPVIPEKRIVISISQQHLWTYENHQLRSEAVISTGIDRSPTIPGVYQVQTHELNAYASVWDLYMPHFMGIYEGWPGFMNGIHGLPTLSGGRRLWAGNLGRPVSYGCIILDLQAAEDLYNWAENGVVVEIRP